MRYKVLIFKEEVIEIYRNIKNYYRFELMSQLFYILFYFFVTSRIKFSYLAYRVDKCCFVFKKIQAAAAVAAAAAMQQMQMSSDAATAAVAAVAAAASSQQQQQQQQRPQSTNPLTQQQSSFMSAT